LGSKPADDLGYVNQHGQSRKHIFDSVQFSLKRLQLDYIDLLQCSSQLFMIAAMRGSQ
jgi:aryl-alcohol dehydrogenase-like predicted oxidoreductase